MSYPRSPRRLAALDVRDRHLALLRTIYGDPVQLKDGGDRWLPGCESHLFAGICEALGRLTARERHLLTLRYGLDERAPMGLAEAGDMLGVTRERVRQIEAKALRKLRHPSYQWCWGPFLRDWHGARWEMADDPLPEPEVVGRWYPTGPEPRVRHRWCHARPLHQQHDRAISILESVRSQLAGMA